jgi:hypothetical protein
LSYIPTQSQPVLIGVGADASAATVSSLHDQAISSFAASGQAAGVVAIDPTGHVNVWPESSDQASAYYDSIVEQANQGMYVYVALFDHAKSATPDGLVDETFTGVGIVQTVTKIVTDVVYSPWIIVVGAAALFGVVYWDKKRKKRRRSRR